MALFSMFLASPPDETPVANVYREKRAFGPGSENDLSFLPSLVIEVAESAAARFRSVRTCCAGWLRVVGVQAGSLETDPNAPLVLALKPIPVAFRLKKLAEQGLFEPPLSFIYSGLDPVTLRMNLMSVINDVKYLNPTGELTPEQRWKLFRDGAPIEINATGYTLAEISSRNLANGFRAFGFAARTNWMHVPDATTPPLNFLDPVTLFRWLVSKELILQSEAENSWLDVVTRNRVLITVRDEWNSPIRDANTSVVVRVDATQHNVALTPERQGTFAAPAGTGSYQISISGRKLTRIASDHHRAEPASEFPNIRPAHHVVSSVRPEDWFHGPEQPIDPTKTLPLFTENNAVKPLIDGFEAFRAMVAELKKIKEPSHFFLFTSWWIDHLFELIPGEPNTTVKSILENINEMRAPIRSLIWHFPAGTRDPHGDLGINMAAHNFISGLGFAKSLFDSRTHHAFFLIPHVFIQNEAVNHNLGPMGVAAVADEFAQGIEERAFHLGAHHSKTYVINGAEGTIAFIGGMDFNPNRLDSPNHLARKPFHDVHSRIAGPAAIDLAKAFVFRWNDHEDNKGTDRRITIAPPSGCPPGETCIDPVLVAPPRDATCMVQIARTFGARTQDYAVEGDRNIWATLKHALGKAKKYVYFEEQYLVSPELSAELADVVTRIDHLVVVFDYSGESFPIFLAPQFEGARHRFFKPLRDRLGSEQFNKKVHVFTLAKNGEPFRVHSKVVIIDDVFATIGSSNMNVRGFTHDTETNAFILDGRVVGGARKFARDLRVRLWAEHLGWIPGGDTSKLWNIDKAVDILVKHRSPAARLVDYNHSRGAGVVQSPRWDTLIEPNGTEPPRDPD